MKFISRLLLCIMSIMLLQTSTVFAATSNDLQELPIYTEDELVNEEISYIVEDGDKINFIFEQPSLPDEFIVKYDELDLRSSNASGYTKWTKDKSKSFTKKDYYMGMHPDWKGYSKEKKAGSYWFSNSRSKSIGFGISADGKVISVGGSVSIETSKANGYSIPADPKRWSRVGVQGDVEMNYWKIDWYTGTGYKYKTTYEYKGRTLRTTPIAIYKW